MTIVGARTERLHALAATCERACGIAERAADDLARLAGQIQETGWVSGPAAAEVERGLLESARLLGSPAEDLRRFAHDLGEHANQQTVTSAADRVADAEPAAKGGNTAAVAAPLKPDEPHDPEYHVRGTGEMAHVAHVPGGTVEVRTGVDIRPVGDPRDPDAAATRDYADGVEISYSGTQAATSRWLRFTWAEVVVERPGEPPTRLGETSAESVPDGQWKPSTSGPVRLTTDPGLPYYSVDGTGGEDGIVSPFYEHGGADLRDATSTTVFDRPTPPLDDDADGLLRQAFEDGAQRVVQRVHYTSYLVRDTEVLYRVETAVTWTYDDPGDYDRDAAEYGPDPVRDTTVVHRNPVTGATLTGPVSTLDTNHWRTLKLDGRFGRFDIR